MPGFTIRYTVTKKTSTGKKQFPSTYACTAATASEAREKFKSHFRSTDTEKYTINSVINSSPR